MQASFIAILTVASVAVLSGCASAETKRTADYTRNLELAKLARASGYTLVNRDGKVLFCRKMTPTGTNVPRSECHTPDDWDAINRHAETAIQQDRVPFQGQP